MRNLVRIWKLVIAVTGLSFGVQSIFVLVEGVTTGNVVPFIVGGTLLFGACLYVAAQLRAFNFGVPLWLCILPQVLLFFPFTPFFKALILLTGFGVLLSILSLFKPAKFEVVAKCLVVRNPHPSIFRTSRIIRYAFWSGKVKPQRGLIIATDETEANVFTFWGQTFIEGNLQKGLAITDKAKKELKA